jgi:hypothetical protein
MEEEEVTIVGIDKEGFYVYQNDKSTCYYSDPASEFRPLRTEAEKNREAFIDGVMRGVSIDAKYTDVIHNIADQLFEAGFTAPEGAEL